MESYIWNVMNIENVQIVWKLLIFLHHSLKNKKLFFWKFIWE